MRLKLVILLMLLSKLIYAGTTIIIPECALSGVSVKAKLFYKKSKPNYLITCGNEVKGKTKCAFYENVTGDTIVKDLKPMHSSEYDVQNVSDVKILQSSDKLTLIYIYQDGSTLYVDNASTFKGGAIIHKYCFGGAKK